MFIPETHLIHSVEGLLTPVEIDRILAVVADILRSRRAEFDVATRKRSVHAIEGVSVDEVKTVYEPQGRIELDELPVEIGELLDAAVERRLPDIRTIYPSVNQAMDWFYVEYGEGQYITPHADYYHNDDNPEIPKLAGISVLLTAPTDGGEFFVETAGSRALWGPDDRLRPGVDYYSPWFRDLPRSRWSVTIQPGDAVCYGTQVIHGTEAVASGHAAKLIGFLA